MRPLCARLYCILIVLAFTSAGLGDAEPTSRPAPAGKPAISRTDRTIQGWSVHIDDRLLTQDKQATEKMLALLDDQLAYIVKVVPAPAVEKLRKVPLWVSPEYAKGSPRAEYHPDGGWLRRNGRDPVMAKGVEFTNVRIFEQEIRRMPVLALHELAHAYHDQVLGFENKDIVAAYDAAKAGKRYDRVERSFGDPKRPHTFEKAYAMTNPLEYFAECSEAFFGENDFYPFNRADLEKQDPEMLKLLERFWNQGK